MKKIFITGTGTDVGKTFVTAGFASGYCKMNQRVGVMKPVQTGIDTERGDLDIVRSLVPDIYPLAPSMANPYSFGMAASPHLAATIEGKEIIMEDIISAFKSIGEIAELNTLLIEGAGGLMVPLNKTSLMLDLIKALDVPVILVTLSGLGTINHTLLSLKMLKREGIEISGVVFNKMPINPGLVEKDNVNIIRELGDVPILGIVNELPPNTSFREHLEKTFPDIIKQLQ